MKRNRMHYADQGVRSRYPNRQMATTESWLVAPDTGITIVIERELRRQNEAAPPKEWFLSKEKA